MNLVEIKLNKVIMSKTWVLDDFLADHEGSKKIQRQMPRGQINTIFLCILKLIKEQT